MSQEAATPEAEAADEAPHAVGMVTWDAPSPAVVGAAATVKVGVQCAHGCDLLGQRVELRDAEGAVVAAGVLDTAPAEGLGDLYWRELSFTAPAATGVSFLTAACAPEGLAAEHLQAASPFSFRTEPRPEHRVAVGVVDEATGRPLEQVEVRMGRYAAYTDAQGEARFALPGGDYSCSIRKLGFKAEPVEVKVAGDLALAVRAGKGETREELEARLSAWENYPWS
jgi:hypothetical protein